MVFKNFLRVPAIFRTNATTPDSLARQKQEEQMGKNKSGKDNGQKDSEGKMDRHKVTKLNSKGVPYRDCPECEGKMYKDGNTWTCDMIGYSYKE